MPNLVKSAVNQIPNGGFSIGVGAQAEADSLMASAVAREADLAVNTNEEGLNEHFKRNLKSLKFGGQTLTGIPAHMEVWQYRETEPGVISKSRVSDGTGTLSTYEFFILQKRTPQQDRVSVLPTFGKDPGLLQAFGRAALQWSFSGILQTGENEGNWYKTFDTFYQDYLRASLLVERNQFIRFRLGRIAMDGYILNYTVDARSETDDVFVNFSFEMFIRDYSFR